MTLKLLNGGRQDGRRETLPARVSLQEGKILDGSEKNKQADKYIR